MSPSVIAGSSKERGGSLLPSHAESTPQGAVVHDGGSNLNRLEERYVAANKQLHELEEELEVLLHSSRSIREQRTKTTLGHLKYLDDGTITLDNKDQVIDEYLALVKKGNIIDDVIKTLKDECTTSRFESSVILSKIRSPSDKLRQTLQARKRSGSGHSETRSAEKGATEDETYIENKLADFAGVAGAFGGGVTFSTTFGAARGRLDLISWAFACFLWVMIDWAVLKLWASLPRRRDLNGGIAVIIRSEHPGYGGAIVASMIEQRSWFISLLALGVAIPLVAGFALLGVSVITLDSDASTPDPGSRMAIRASGYSIVALLGNLLFWTVLAVAAYPALRHLYQIHRLLPGLKDLHVSGTIPKLSK